MTTLIEEIQKYRVILNEEFGRKDEDPDYTVDQETAGHEKKGPDCEGKATDADSPLTKKIRESGPWGKKVFEAKKSKNMDSKFRANEPHPFTPSKAFAKNCEICQGAKSKAIHQKKVTEDKQLIEREKLTKVVMSYIKRRYKKVLDASIQGWPDNELESYISGKLEGINIPSTITNRIVHKLANEITDDIADCA